LIVRNLLYNDGYNNIILLKILQEEIEQISQDFLQTALNSPEVQRYLPSMKEINTITGIPMCKPMTDNDIMLYIPHKL
jgi:hypothetical protein